MALPKFGPHLQSDREEAGQDEVPEPPVGVPEPPLGVPEPVMRMSAQSRKISFLAAVVPQRSKPFVTYLPHSAALHVSTHELPVWYSLQADKQSDVNA